MKSHRSAGAVFSKKEMKSWKAQSWWEDCNKIDALYDEVDELLPPLGK